MALSITGGAALKGVKMSKVTAGFNPVTFWSGYQGGFWDFTDSANLFADAALTTPATLDATGGVLGVTDLSGLGNKLVTYTLFTNTSFTMRSGYCESNLGALTTASTLSLGNTYTAIALVRPTSIGSLQNIVDTDFGTGNRVAQNLIITTSGYIQSYIFGYSSPSVVMTSPVLSAGTDYLVAAATDNTDSNLVAAGTVYNSGSGGTLVGGVVAPGVGASYGGTLTPIYQQFTGRIYCAAYITKKCTPAEIAEIGAYMNTLAGTSAVV
jgi:hypothetical protein